MMICAINECVLFSRARNTEAQFIFGASRTTTLHQCNCMSSLQVAAIIPAKGVKHAQLLLLDNKPSYNHNIT
jgi:hypothetical protein